VVNAFYIRRILEGRTDGGADLAKLEIEGEIEFPRLGAEFGGDARAMFDVTHGIIGEFYDERRLGNGLGRRGGRRVRHYRCPVSSRGADENRNVPRVYCRDHRDWSFHECKQRCLVTTIRLPWLINLHGRRTSWTWSRFRGIGRTLKPRGDYALHAFGPFLRSLTDQILGHTSGLELFIPGFFTRPPRRAW
jgi:hypothetical protein